MPSSTIVTNQSTLQQNFEENAQELFCNIAFQGAALASGAGLLWLTPFAATGALALGSGLIAMTLCPAGWDKGKVFGGSPPFTGGQCNTVYSVTGRAERPGGFPPSQVTSQLNGPVINLGYYTIADGAPANGYWFKGTQPDGISPAFSAFDQVPESFYSSAEIIDVVRMDGLPDDCGNPPPDPPGQIIPGPDGADTIDPDTVPDNSSETVVFPINFDIDGKIGTINMPFSNPRIQANIPIRFLAQVGGINIAFEGSDAGFSIVPSNDESISRGLEEIFDRLESIESCVCSPAVELDMLNLPLVQEVDEECNDISINLLAARGTYPVNIEQQFEQSRVLADKGCSEPPPNVPRTIILSGQGTGTQQIFTSEMLSADIRVIEFEVTEFGPDTRLFIGGNNNPSQGRFGVVSPGFFDSDQEFYAMPGLAQYYQRSLIVIPNEIISALGVRVSVSVGTTFNIWDTGLRFSST